MIIRGGINIYPIEIEITRHHEEICAWIKLKSNETKCQAEDIVKFLSDKIGFFKIPKYIRIVDKFIITSTGKVQKFKMSEVMINELNKNK
ncbi:unnamed protein product [Rotaria sordida]|uniref:AMP-binding enzyme C-terminal domain-containing protein n=1 Tax=Rotaria sordida TaxID=392033 RepID=A0A819JRZ8_9BILA|nr:unnamed protein product [Rotaria sordida]CAF0917059.1 unnamed protein product [Rotaria sordida]CAF1186730.1 unnamed protein product [Rotaria sordida]CAF3932120.1 unnamed protein product [Rotaria sordida]